MPENTSHIIRNIIIAVVGAVVGGLILASILSSTIKSLVLRVMKPVGSLLAGMWEWLISTHLLPGWLIVLLSIAAIAIIIIIAVEVFSKEVEHHRYVEDFFEGAKWRWQWVSDSINNLWAFCPKCDGELVYDDRTRADIFEREDKTLFHCEKCKCVITALKGDKGYAMSAVEREIRRRVRTGEYKKSDGQATVI